MTLSTAKFGLSSLKNKIRLKQKVTYCECLDIGIECIEIVQRLQSNSCNECRLKVNDGGYRCLLQSPPHDFCNSGAYEGCPLKIKRG